MTQLLYRKSNMRNTTLIAKSTGTSVNLKEQNAKHTFTINFRDTEHFYKVVNWLNANVGKGKDMWTIEGRVKRLLTGNRAGVTVSKKVYIFTNDFDPQSSLYLNLL